MYKAEPPPLQPPRARPKSNASQSADDDRSRDFVHFEIGDTVTTVENPREGKVASVENNTINVEFTDPPREPRAFTFTSAQLRIIKKRDEAPKRTFQFLTIEDLRNIPPPAWLVPGYIKKKSYCLLYGPSGGCKSFFALDLALCVATGEKFLGQVVKRGRCLYIAIEGSEEFTKRVDAWLRRHPNAKESDIVENLTFITDVVPFLEAKTFNEFFTQVRDQLPNLDLLVIDTQSRCTAGADENGSIAFSLYNEGIERLRKLTGATIISIHHGNKNDRKSERGHGNLRAAVDSAMYLETRDDDSVVLESMKQRNMKDFAEVRFAKDEIVLGHEPDTGIPITSHVLRPLNLKSNDRQASKPKDNVSAKANVSENDSTETSGNVETLIDKLLDKLPPNEGLSVLQIMEKLDLKKHTAYEAVKALKASKRITKLPDTGKESLYRKIRERMADADC